MINSFSSIIIVTNKELTPILDNWEIKLGIGPWHIKHISTDISESSVKKRATDFDVAWAFIGNRIICIINPQNSFEPMDSFLKKHGPGLFGLGVNCSEEDFSKGLDKLDNTGIKPAVMELDCGFKAKAYDSREKLGCNLILFNGSIDEDQITKDEKGDLFQNSKTMFNPQVGITFRNEIKDIIHNWYDLLEIEPWISFEFTEEQVGFFNMDNKTDMRPFRERIAVTNVGDLEIELIANLEGECSVYPYLQNHDIGMQHVKFFCKADEFENGMQKWKEKGMPRNVWGNIGTALFANYHTFKQLGCDIELGNVTELDVSEWSFYKYPLD